MRRIVMFSFDMVIGLFPLVFCLFVSLCPFVSMRLKLEVYYFSASETRSTVTELGMIGM